MEGDRILDSNSFDVETSTVDINLASIDYFHFDNNTISYFYPFEDNLTAIHILNNKSLLQLQLNMPCHLTYIIIGNFGILTNLAIFVTLGFWKPLRGKGQICLINLAIANLLECVYFTQQGIKRLVYTVYEMSNVMTTDACRLTVFPGRFAMVSCIVMTFGLSVDRLLIVTRPIAYQKLSSKYIVTFSLLLWLYCAVVTAMMFYHPPSTQLLPYCSGPSTYSEFYSQFATFESMLFTAVIILNTIVVLVTIKFKRQRWRSHPPTPAVVSEIERQTRYVKALTALIVVYSICYGLSSALMLYSHEIFGTGKDTTQLTWLSNSFVLFNSAINFFIYLAVVKSFRRGFFNIVLRIRPNAYTTTVGLDNQAVIDHSKVQPIQVTPTNIRFESRDCEQLPSYVHKPSVNNNIINSSSSNGNANRSTVTTSLSAAVVRLPPISQTNSLTQRRPEQTSEYSEPEVVEVPKYRSHSGSFRRSRSIIVVDI